MTLAFIQKQFEGNCSLISWCKEMKLLKFLVIQLGPLFQYLIEEQMYEQFWDFLIFRMELQMA